ncbi:MAG: hypothetical protein K1X57_01055 [Gemmataceae bacterium]|nr:hypothetical protein [Gemmataceae bacterium]
MSRPLYSLLTVALFIGGSLGSRYLYRQWITGVIHEAQSASVRDANRFKVVKPLPAIKIDPASLKPPTVNVQQFGPPANGGRRPSPDQRLH